MTAVSPTDADTLFVLSADGGSADGRRAVPLDRRRRRRWQPVLSTTDAISDVVIVDATHVIVSTATTGSFESTDGGATFNAMTGAPQLACLGQRDDGKLFGCGANWDPDFKAVAASSDGATWSKVFRFVELAGPLACPAGTAEADTCAPGWATVQQQFASTGPTCGANAQPDAGVDQAPDGLQKNPSGGCDTSAGGPTLLVAGLGIGLVLRRRRRGQ